MRVERRMHNGFPGWDDEERGIVAEMFAQGCDDKQIGERLHRSAGAVARQRLLQGLRRAKHPPRKREVHTDAMAEYYPRWWREHLKRQQCAV